MIGSLEVSVLLRDWIVVGLESAAGDPVTEIRRCLDAAQRTLNRIAGAA